tara:strand:- start:5529 stop:6590 length:1062 start_codon:yes stop_codon:yes gene_type:complete
MNDYKNLVKISKFAGERYDLIQAAGGNTSVKLENGEMLIKASGFLLSELNEFQGVAKVKTKDVIDIISNKNIIITKDKRKRDLLTARLIKSATLETNRPSIETLIHSLLLKYTLHTHPIAVMTLVIKDNWKQLLNKIFKEDNIVLIDYFTPGIELAIALQKKLKTINTIPHIYFLQNHGLIISSNSVDDIITKTEYVVEKIENFLSIDLNQYKYTTKISYLISRVEQVDLICSLCEDEFINKMLQNSKECFFTLPCSPDTFVYCGYETIEINNENDIESIKKYQLKYNELPKIIIFNEKIFLVSKSLRKNKEIEEVLKFHLMSIFYNNQVQSLSGKEMKYLASWEAEQYRQKK